VRGSPRDNRIMMSPGHEEGFGFLRASAIDQHVDARGREEDLRPVLRAHPALLGVGLDEATAIIVRGDEAEVVGQGKVRFFAAPDSAALILRAGERFDLGERRPLPVVR
jgi:cyanophycinase